MAKTRKVADREMAIMGKVFDLLALLEPTRRRAVYDFIGTRIDALPTIAEVRTPEPAEPTMFSEAEARAIGRSIDEAQPALARQRESVA